MKYIILLVLLLTVFPINASKVEEHLIMIAMRSLKDIRYMCHLYKNPIGCSKGHLAMIPWVNNEPKTVQAKIKIIRHPWKKKGTCTCIIDGILHHNIGDSFNKDDNAVLGHAINELLDLNYPFNLEAILGHEFQHTLGYKHELLIYNID